MGLRSVSALGRRYVARSETAERKARALLRRPRIVYSVPERTDAIALTFDDGPSHWTPQILDVLAAHGARTTFFVVGAAVAGREDILRRLVAEGHEIGNHTYSHPDPAGISDEQLDEELRRATAAVEHAVGIRPRLFRPPFAVFDRRVARRAARAGLRPTVLRSVDPADWHETEPRVLVEAVVSKAGPGEIICMHDGIPSGHRGIASRRSTVDAVREIVPTLLSRGLRLVTVSELLA